MQRYEIFLPSTNYLKIKNVINITKFNNYIQHAFTFETVSVCLFPPTSVCVFVVDTVASCSTFNVGDSEVALFSFPVDDISPLSAWTLVDLLSCKRQVYVVYLLCQYELLFRRKITQLAK